MRNSGKGAGGVLAAILVILGVLLASGIGGLTTGILAKLVKWAGIALVTCGVGVVLIVVGAIIAAAMDNKTDEHQEAKMSVNQSIEERRQQLAKLKSSQTVLNMSYKRIVNQLAEVDKKIATCNTNAEDYLRQGNEAMAKNELAKKQTLLKSRENVAKTEEGYRSNLSQLEALIDQLSGEITDMELRRDSANAKIKMAEAKQSMSGYKDAVNSGSQDSLSDYEKQAQYSADLAAALEQLEKSLGESELPFDKYDIDGSKGQKPVIEGQKSVIEKPVVETDKPGQTMRLR